MPPYEKNQIDTTNFNHDINDQNNSILLGTDLLLRYWEELSEYLLQVESEIDPEERESLDEIRMNVPVVIAGIRKSVQKIETIITKNRK